MSEGRLLRVLELVGRNWWHYWFLGMLMILVGSIVASSTSTGAASVSGAFILGGIVFCLFGATLGELDTAIRKVRQDGGVWKD